MVGWLVCRCCETPNRWDGFFVLDADVCDRVGRVWMLRLWQGKKSLIKEWQSNDDVEGRRQAGRSVDVSKKDNSKLFFSIFPQ